MSGGVKAHRAETTLAFEVVVEGRLNAIVEQANSIRDQMESSFMTTLFETISKGVEEVGNVVDAKGKPATEVFLETLRKIEFGVGRDGEVGRPEIHMHPDTASKFVNALESAGPAFEAEVERIMAEKDAQALARERERKSRFKNPTRGK